MAAVSSKFGMT